MEPGVQICAMVALLEKRGFHLLDLGQDLPYKLKLGAKLLPRNDFVKAYHAGRTAPSPDLSDGEAGWPCDELIRPKAAALAAARRSTLWCWLSNSSCIALAAP